MNTKLNLKPDGILITMPVRFFSEYPGGHGQFWRIMHMMGQHDVVWGQTISTIPKVMVPYCYLVFGGKVQLRLNIIDFERKCTKKFNDGGIIRTFHNKNWVNLCGPMVKASIQIPMQGFQGFRYTEYLF